MKEEDEKENQLNRWQLLDRKQQKEEGSCNSIVNILRNRCWIPFSLIQFTAGNFPSTRSLSLQCKLVCFQDERIKCLNKKNKNEGGRSAPKNNCWKCIHDINSLFNSPFLPFPILHKHAALFLRNPSRLLPQASYVNHQSGSQWRSRKKRIVSSSSVVSTSFTWTSHEEKVIKVLKCKS